MSWVAFAYVALFSMWLGSSPGTAASRWRHGARPARCSWYSPSRCWPPCRCWGERSMPPPRLLARGDRRRCSSARCRSHRTESNSANWKNHELHAGPPRRGMNPDPGTFVTEKPGHRLAGRRPALAGETFRSGRCGAACERPCCATRPWKALQYAASEGLPPAARGGVAAEMGAHGLAAEASQVLITTGSQQGLDLVGRCCSAPAAASRWTPTYLGALGLPYEPDGDLGGPATTTARCPRRWRAARRTPLYLLPNFQNPSGRCAAQRGASRWPTRARDRPGRRDNPTANWFDAEPPPPLASQHPQRLDLPLAPSQGARAQAARLGCAQRSSCCCRPPEVFHTPGFNQRVVHEVIRDLLPARVIRAHLRAQSAMRCALRSTTPSGQPRCRAGGTFFSGRPSRRTPPRDRTVAQGMACPAPVLPPTMQKANTLRERSPLPADIERGTRCWPAEGRTHEHRCRFTQLDVFTAEPLKGKPAGRGARRRAGDAQMAAFARAGPTSARPPSCCRPRKPVPTTGCIFTLTASRLSPATRRSAAATPGWPPAAARSAKARWCGNAASAWCARAP